MKNLIIKRMGYSILIFFFVSVLIFFLIRILPGDPIQAAAMGNMNLANADIIEDLRIQFGLDRPLPEQYIRWLTHFLSGEWGISFGTGEKVWDMFMHRLPITLELFVFSVVWAFFIGFPLGVLAAVKRNSWMDTTLTTTAIFGVSVPVFWEAIVLIYLLAVTWQIFPPSGFVPVADGLGLNLLSVMMPSFVIGTHSAGLIMRYVRTSLLETLGQDYIRTARAKGLSNSQVLLKHAAKPSLAPVITIIGIDWGYIVAGSFIVEYMFAIPGLGRMGVDAIFARDFPVIQATLLVVAVNILMVNLMVDIIYGYLDPRVRVQ